MSGPSFSLPRDIFELLTTTVVWEAFQGFDGHAEPSYGPPVTLTCWNEVHGLVDGGLQVYRKADGTVVEPIMDMFFDGDDANARMIQLYDRFTISIVGIPPQQPLQAVRVATWYGPPFDNTNPWLILVTL